MSNTLSYTTLFRSSAPAQDRLWWRPTTGEHEVVVMDDAGLSAQRGVRVVRR